MNNSKYQLHNITNINPSAYHSEELKQYFLKIYILMSLGLALTALAAFSVYSIPVLKNMMFNIAPNGYLIGNTNIGMLITFAPLGIALYFSFRLHKINAQSAQILFWAYSTLVGMSLASLGFIYTEASITKTFFICSGMFAGMSLYGYNTKKNLTSLGSFLLMGLIGLVIASLVNMLFKSAMMEFILSIIGVIIFTGLIAYDTQKLKSFFLQGANNTQKLSVIGAFMLYLDFINLFLYLLRFFGARKDKN